MGSDRHVGSRLAFIDNLRTLIIILVILVHLAITYGGEGGWYYKEVKPDLVSGLVLTFHNATCQSFFMGSMFLLSGYFTPASFDRKGPWKFLLDRLVRLGIPMLFYDLVIHPFLIYWLARHNVYHLSFRSWATSYYTSFHLGRGPLWFVEALLLFSVVYILWRLATGKRVPQAAADSPTPNGFSLTVLAISLGL
ncbi:MAG TPA: acyltransferase family protein, partial [Sedimentisphaerales bacterium]|nr:acyltransferase family protein [Sedimentisphaerales bacterium]